MSNEDVPSMAWLPTSRGEFKIEVFHEDATGLDHVALTLGDMKGPDRSRRSEFAHETIDARSGLNGCCDCHQVDR